MDETRELRIYLQSIRTTQDWLASQQRITSSGLREFNQIRYRVSELLGHPEWFKRSVPFLHHDAYPGGLSGRDLQDFARALAQLRQVVERYLPRPSDPVEARRVAERLREENRRLHAEVQTLRDLATRAAEPSGSPITAEAYRALDERARSVLDEAVACYCHGCYLACTALCRALLDRVLKFWVAVEHVKPNGSGLGALIEALRQAGQLQAPGAQIGSLVKHFGDEALHDLSEPATRERAAAGMGLLAVFLAEAYQPWFQGTAYADV